MKQPSVEELDNYWHAVLDKPNPPDIIVSLNARLERASKAVMDAEDELRDWARMQIAERK